MLDQEQGAQGQDRGRSGRVPVRGVELELREVGERRRALAEADRDLVVGDAREALRVGCRRRGERRLAPPGLAGEGDDARRQCDRARVQQVAAAAREGEGEGRPDRALETAGRGEIGTADAGDSARRAGGVAVAVGVGHPHRPAGGFGADFLQGALDQAGTAVDLPPAARPLPAGTSRYPSARGRSGKTRVAQQGAPGEGELIGARGRLVADRQVDLAPAAATLLHAHPARTPVDSR